MAEKYFKRTSNKTELGAKQLTVEDFAQLAVPGCKISAEVNPDRTIDDTFTATEPLTVIELSKQFIYHAVKLDIPDKVPPLVGQIMFYTESDDEEARAAAILAINDLRPLIEAL